MVSFGRHIESSAIDREIAGSITTYDIVLHPGDAVTCTCVGVDPQNPCHDGAFDAGWLHRPRHGHAAFQADLKVRHSADEPPAFAADWSDLTARLTGSLLCQAVSKRVFSWVFRMPHPLAELATLRIVGTPDRYRDLLVVTAPIWMTALPPLIATV